MPLVLLLSAYGEQFVASQIDVTDNSAAEIIYTRTRPGYKLIYDGHARSDVFSREIIFEYTKCAYCVNKTQIFTWTYIAITHKNMFFCLSDTRKQCWA
jgi:hypothetical protein